MKRPECGGIDFTKFPILKDSIFPSSLPSRNKFYIYRRLDGALYMYDYQGIETKIEGSGGGSVTIINNLNSNRTDAALAANQGRILNNTKADKSDVNALQQVVQNLVNGKADQADLELLEERVTIIEEELDDLIIGDLDELQRQIDELEENKISVKLYASGIIKQDPVDTYNDTSGGKTSLLSQYPDPELGWAVKVLHDENHGGQSRVYQWDGEEWFDLQVSDFAKEYSLEIYEPVEQTNSLFTIDYKDTPYASIYLDGDNIINEVQINNVSEGSIGKILVKQKGGKKLGFTNAIGYINLPSTVDSMILITYFQTNGQLYAFSNIVRETGQEVAPERIKDFLVVNPNTPIRQFFL